MPKDNSIKSVLIIGSGPIVIGQACEFDYAGSQSARSIREEGIEVILINSNPATIMTDPSMADHIYLKPLTTKSIIEILKAHPQIDAVLPTMGGQTALNLAIDCDAAGIWEKYGVRIIGVDIAAIETTEDREKFRLKMIEIGVGVCKGRTARSFLEGKEIAQETGRFDLDAVAKGISDKLIRRHPHVFGEAVAGDPDAVLKQWDEIKRGEKGEADVPYLHGTGKGLPALVRGAKLLKKAAKVGFDWPVETGVISKIREELLELQSAIDEQDMPAVEEELGDLLFSVVNLSRFRKIDPEVLMARANAKFERRFGEMEKALKAAGKTLEAATLGEMEDAWIAAKLRGF
jgi:MazG family protein